MIAGLTRSNILEGGRGTIGISSPKIRRGIEKREPLAAKCGRVRGHEHKIGSNYRHQHEANQERQEEKGQWVWCNTLILIRIVCGQDSTLVRIICKEIKKVT